MIIKYLFNFIYISKFKILVYFFLRKMNPLIKKYKKNYKLSNKLKNICIIWSSTVGVCEDSLLISGNMERQWEVTQQLRVITDPGVTLVQFPAPTKACRSSTWVLDSLLWPPSSLHSCGIHIHRYTQKDIKKLKSFP